MGIGEHSLIAGWRIALGADVALTDARGASCCPRARKARGLLAYLSMLPGHAASRREIIDLLWSDRGPDQGRASLRQCLFELKSEAPGLIATTNDTIALTPGVTVTGAAYPTLEELIDLDPAFDRWHEALLRQRRPIVRSMHYGRYWLIGVAALVTACVAAWALQSKPKQFIPDVAITASGMQSDVADAFAEAARQTMPGRYLHVRMDTGAAAGADWIVGVSKPEAGGTMAVRIATRAGQELWTERLPISAGGGSAAAELGRRAGETALCTTRTPGGPPRDPDLLTMLMDVCGKLARRDDTADVLIAARRLAATYPDFAFGHAILAMNLVYGAVPLALANSTQAEADREARRALALDSQTGEAWMALGVLAQKRRQYREAEALLRKGLSAQPDHGPLNNFLADILAAIGRTDEALIYAKRAASLDPASPIKLISVATLLSEVGRSRAALDLLDQAEKERGRTRLLSRARLDILEQSGDTDGALSLIGQNRGPSSFLEPVEESDTRSALTAIRSSSPISPDLRARILVNQDRTTVLMRAFVAKGRTAEAVALAETGGINSSGLFGPEMKSLWRDRRFPEIAQRLQIWRYWTATNRWPDICSDQALEWRCVTVNTPSTQ
jgi:tetratricopeptide (TPR) repeat protein